MTHSQFHCMYLVLILTHPWSCIPFIILATLQTHTITIICNSHYITNHKYLSHQPTLWHRFDVHKGISASHGYWPLNGRSRTKPNLVIIMSADAITPTGTRLSSDTARQRETFYFNISMALDNFGYSYRSGNMIHNGRKRLRKVSRLFEC